MIDSLHSCPQVVGWEEEIAGLRATLEEMEERHRRELEAAKDAMASRHKAEEANVKAEVRRLQELRRYIQQECDQLLMRKVHCLFDACLNATSNLLEHLARMIPNFTLSA